MFLFKKKRRNSGHRVSQILALQTQNVKVQALSPPPFRQGAGEIVSRKEKRGQTNVLSTYSADWSAGRYISSRWIYISCVRCGSIRHSAGAVLPLCDAEIYRPDLTLLSDHPLMINISYFRHNLAFVFTKFAILERFCTVRI